MKKVPNLVGRSILVDAFIYPTFAKLGPEFSISGSYAFKIYDQMVLILVKELRLKSRKHLMRSDLNVVVIDATEQPTIKAQLIIDFDTLEILSVVCRKGRLHDLRILKENWVAICPSTEKLSDSGYQRIKKLYPNSDIPQKRQKGKSLSVIAKRRNTELSKRRIRIEHVNRHCKIFRITKETYRGKHKNSGRSWHVICCPYQREIFVDRLGDGSCQQSIVRLRTVRI